MRILRFPFTDSAGVVSIEAMEAMGDVLGRPGRSFGISYVGDAGAQMSVTVDLVGQLCFIPPQVPDRVVAEIIAQLEPLVESDDLAQRRFLRAVFAVSGCVLA